MTRWPNGFRLEFKSQTSQILLKRCNRINRYVTASTSTQIQ